MQQELSATVLQQRWRNNIMRYWAWVSSYDEQREYQATVPLVHIPHEAINQWADWVTDDTLPTFIEPVFSVDEQAAMRDYLQAWEAVCEDTPQMLPPLAELIGTESWERLRSAAESALAAFLHRGYWPACKSPGVVRRRGEI